MQQTLSVSRQVVIIGAGVMGRGIAMVAAAAGHPVCVYDANGRASVQAVETIHQHWQRQADKGKLSVADVARLGERLSRAEQLEQLAEAGLVIEAIVEDLAAKQALFCQLEQIVAADCLLATNTSSLSITAIAAAMAAPQRLVGMHFFNPAPAMRLVEIVRGLATEADVLEQVSATARAWGKETVLVRSSPGFIVNRIARPFYLESLRCLQQGLADCATLDRLLQQAGGFRMGPFALMDLIGLDVNLAVHRAIWQAMCFDPRYTPLWIQQEMVAAGWLGRKSGRGYYVYPQVEPAVVEPLPEPCPDWEQVAFNLVQPVAAVLAQRLQQAGVPVVGGHDTASDWLFRLGTAHVYLSDGRPAARREQVDRHPCLLLDQAVDFQHVSLLAAQSSPRLSAPDRQALEAVLGEAGIRLCHLPDAAGLPVLRTVAMLVNEAADVLQQGLASTEDIDRAMCLGLNYPQGPLAWGRRLGYGWLAQVLRHLADYHGDGHYRIAGWLQQQAFSSLSSPAEVL
ncbi:3-hydroxyacyl-CoA dehydrogenase [Aquitalea sp. LB_tupeE]|uniref:3-hydroxyacyl-CoA dehydrogenase n=1 Tax=Aquitalea sp. LB_tupeE TaxID=2748078 RepID=UPI0015BED05B|nr:3-hydroxyacyl-CoA dehydrogenase [Aquitalea sp. LB_tupeE]NWK78109.1 3-hydroxyacyl-CoA dehydrogenase [Aquitalea sp. LB_tupeE]